MPAAIEAHRTFDLERCRRIAASFHDRLPPVGPNPAPQMWATELPPGDAPELERRLHEEYQIEVPVKEWKGRRVLRVSIAPYNDEADVERLLGALDELRVRP